MCVIFIEHVFYSFVLYNITDQKSSSSFKTMVEPVKLLDENLEFNSAALEFLNDSNTNYLVVGVLGML